MSNSTAHNRRKRTASREELIRKHGLYAPTFTPEELEYLDAQPEARPEFALLRTKILRLAKLTPLKTSTRTSWMRSSSWCAWWQRWMPWNAPG